MKRKLASKIEVNDFAEHAQDVKICLDMFNDLAPQNDLKAKKKAQEYLEFGMVQFALLTVSYRHHIRKYEEGK